MLRALARRCVLRTTLVTETIRRASLYFGLVLICAAGAIGVANAQQPVSATIEPPNAIDALKAIDQLTEQNRQLEKQNQQLMEQISILRRALAAQQPLPPPEGEKPARPTASRPAAHTGMAHAS